MHIIDYDWATDENFAPGRAAEPPRCARRGRLQSAPGGGPRPRMPSGMRTAAGVGAVLLAVLGVFAWQGSPVDSSRELGVIAQAAEQGDVHAELMLALAYRDGRGGLAHDQAAADRWLRRAADDGSVYAADLLGNAYMNGRGVEADAASAVQWWSKAAQAGSADAERRLAGAYLDGKGVARDPEAARHWLALSADEGDGTARELLRQMYRNGLVDARDVTGADTLDALATRTHSTPLMLGAIASEIGAWLSRAAAQSEEPLQARAEAGDPIAQYQLGWRYHTGAWAVPRDDVKAVNWLERAAKNGNRLAMRSLAGIYARGTPDITADAGRAAYWRDREQSTTSETLTP